MRLEYLADSVKNKLIDVYTRSRYNMNMIQSFADKETEKIYNQEFSKRLPQSIQRLALRKLIMIDNAETAEDLRVPPGNRLEALKGEKLNKGVINVFRDV